MVETTLDLFAPALPTTERVMLGMPQLVADSGGLSARDLVHVATRCEADIDVIAGADTGFDQVVGLQRTDPDDAPELLSR
jgi:predicted nucleic acid-binding protein